MDHFARHPAAYGKRVEIKIIDRRAELGTGIYRSICGHYNNNRRCPWKREDAKIGARIRRATQMRGVENRTWKPSKQIRHKWKHNEENILQYVRMN